MGDEVGGADVRRQAVVLGHVADELAQHHALAAHVEAEQGGVAAGRRQQAEQDLDQRALAGAVGADQADDPRLDRHAEGEVESSAVIVP